MTKLSTLILNSAFCVSSSIQLKISIASLSSSTQFNDKDLIIMALIMHDGLKKGIEEEENTRFDHPLLVSKLIMENVNNLEMDIDEIRKMCMLIESHMGKWNTNKYSKLELPVPTNELQRYVHRCDYLASRSYLNIKFIKLDIE